jgi:hypothetical protein
MRAFLPVLMVSLFPLFACAEDVPATAPSTTEAPQSVRLLTIGNSFSHNATRFLGDLAKSTGDVLVLREAIVGGASLELHWTKARKFESDPRDKQGRYTTGKSLTEELQAGPWDVITIQQASLLSHDVETYRPFAGQLVDTIRKHAPRATVMIHQTWAYRSDSPRFDAARAKLGDPVSQRAMYDGLAASYKTIASELGLQRIPVGDAFFLADTDANWGYRKDTAFDFLAARHPALPDQTHSLHVGWEWKRQSAERWKLALDGNHASLAGEYLGACVWYEVLFRKPCEQTTFVPKGLDRDYAKFLRETAHAAVVAAK